MESTSDARHVQNTPAIRAARFGHRVALAAGTMTLATFAVAIATPPLSGQLCKVGCVAYPYLDVASRFPRDYYWLFGAIPATLL